MADDPNSKQRWEESEAAIDALRRQEVDAIVGADRVMLLRLREVEQKLRESEQRFRVLVEATAQATWETDAQGHVVEESDSWLQYTGQSAGESLGDGWLQAIHPDDRSAFKQHWEQSVSQQINLDAEFRIRGPHGSWRWTHARAAPIRDHDGEVLKWVGMNSDITRRKASEESLQRARDAAEAANRSRGEFLANMSHEIRTPMTAILGYADILHEHLKDPDNLQCVETIRRNGRFLVDVINDILDLSKIDAGRMVVERSDVRLDSLIGEVMSLMRVRADEKRLPLHLQCDGKIPAVIETDAVRVRQTLLNLLSNAIKFTDHGKVTLAIHYAPDRQQLQFDISDTGIGIDEQELDRLFEPFTQADASTTRVFGGTGLGLTISRRMAKALGGDISARSTLGKGSTFTLNIDCGNHSEAETIDLDLQPLVENDDRVDAVELDGNILVVDDRRDIRFLAERIICEAGGRVITATDGAQAVDALAQRKRDSQPIDLVLMDMQMPVMDGFEATKQLRRDGFTKPIIALTADAMTGDRERCLAAGCTDFASKPLHARELTRTIAKYLDATKD